MAMEMAYNVVHYGRLDSQPHEPERLFLLLRILTDYKSAGGSASPLLITSLDAAS